MDELPQFPFTVTWKEKQWQVTDETEHMARLSVLLPGANYSSLWTKRDLLKALNRGVISLVPAE